LPLVPEPAVLLVLVHTAQAKNGDNTKATTAAATAVAAAVMPERTSEESAGGMETAVAEGGGRRIPLWIFLIPAHVTL